MKSIYYENSAGEIIDLMEAPYLLQTGDFFDYEWEYSTIGTRNNRISAFYKTLKERSMVLSIRNDGREKFWQAVDYFHEVVDYDVLHKTPGKLYFGESYQKCYITESKKSDWESGIEQIDLELTRTVEDTNWYAEEYYHYYVSDPDEQMYLDYPYDYDHDYYASLVQRTISNESNMDADIEIIIFGHIVNPSINIGEYSYEVEAVVEDGEYLTINTDTKKVYLTKKDGTTENRFYGRRPRLDFFRTLPPGTHTITWPGTFGYDIRILHRRSEPKWN